MKQFIKKLTSSSSPLTFATKNISIIPHASFSSPYSNLRKHIKQKHPRFDAYLRLIRFDKQIGTQLLLLPCYWGIFIASGSNFIIPKIIETSLLFTTGAFLARSAGCIINDLTDVNIDSKVQRTQQRPLTTNQILLPDAYKALAASMGASFLVLFSLSPMSIKLGLCITPFVILYPSTKRFFKYPQFVLGINFAFGAVMGYVEMMSRLAGTIDLSVMLPLYISGILWTIYYDSVYAFQDIKDDTKLQLNSTAIEISKFCQKRNGFLGKEKNILGILSSTSWMLANVAAFQAGIINTYYIFWMGTAGLHLLNQYNKFDWKPSYIEGNQNEKLYWNIFESNKIYGLLVGAAILSGAYFSSSSKKKNN